MRFKVGRDTLSEAVQWTARALPSRPAIPILAGVRIAARDGILELSSFDYEISACVKVEAAVETPGDCLVSGKLLAEIAKSLPNKEVTFAVVDNHVELRCGNAGFTLATMPLDDYPQSPVFPQLQGTVESQAFTRAIQQVVIAASKDETLPLLTGIRLEIEGSQITFLSTDRYRLALHKMDWMPVDPNFKATILVKAKVISDIAKSITTGGKVEMFLNSDTQGERSSIIGFSVAGRQATSVLMDGEYPPVRKLLPEATPLEYSCKRLELLEAVKRVSLVAERKTSVRLTFADGALSLEAGQGDNAQAQESVELFTSSEELRTAFSPQYLQEGLTVCDTEYVKFGFTHPTKAAVLTGQKTLDESTNEEFQYLLMPIRFGV